VICRPCNVTFKYERQIREITRCVKYIWDNYQIGRSIKITQRWRHGAAYPDQRHILTKIKDTHCDYCQSIAPDVSPTSSPRRRKSVVKEAIQHITWVLRLNPGAYLRVSTPPLAPLVLSQSLHDIFFFVLFLLYSLVRWPPVYYCATTR